MQLPIWQDVQYDTATTADITYTIEQGSTTLFSGTAKGYTGNTGKIIINRDISTYIDANDYLPFTQGYVDNNRRHSNISLKIGSTTARTDAWIYDWSYDDSIDYDNNVILNIPLSTEVDPRQWQLFSLYDIEGTTAQYTRAGVTTDLSDWDGDQTYLLPGPQTRNVTTTFKEVGGTREITYNSTGCGEYALYYRNSLGGWDTILVKRGKKTTSYNRTTITKDKLNTSTYLFNKDVVYNTITESWTLNLIPILDSLSDEVVKNLFSSDKVYLHSLNGGEIKPVIITSTSVTEQKFMKNGRLFNYYVLEVEGSDDKIKI